MHRTDDMAVAGLALAQSTLQTLWKKGLITDDEFRDTLREAVASAGPNNQRGVETIIRALFANADF